MVRQSHYTGDRVSRYTCDMPRCAFCLRTATLTGEHLWSEWMGDLLPQERYIFAKQFAGDPVVKIWESKEMNAKAIKRVCGLNRRTRASGVTDGATCVIACEC